MDRDSIVSIKLDANTLRSTESDQLILGTKINESDIQSYLKTEKSSYITKEGSINLDVLA